MVSWNWEVVATKKITWRHTMWSWAMLLWISSLQAVPFSGYAWDAFLVPKRWEPILQEVYELSSSQRWSCQWMCKLACVFSVRICFCLTKWDKLIYYMYHTTVFCYHHVSAGRVTWVHWRGLDVHDVHGCWRKHRKKRGVETWWYHHQSLSCLECLEFYLEYFFGGLVAPTKIKGL